MKLALSILVLITSLFVTPLLASERGPVTNLPMPRFVSLKAGEGNARRGPSLSHRIDWVFTRRNMPLKIIAEYGHWRRVVDRDGMGGWMHYTLLSGARTVLIEEDLAPLRRKADQASTANAYLEAGVVGRLGTCETGWCRVTLNGAKGWLRPDQVWGVSLDK